MNLFKYSTHSYATRQLSTPKVLKHKSQIYNLSFLCKAISFWNSFASNHSDVINADQLPSLRVIVKRFKYDRFALY